ncbi:MAG: RDD family protein [Candidatus Sericytochromatia bacterium]
MAVAGSGHAGESLGLPASGSRSLAPFGRRLLALLVDWLIAYGLAALGMSFGWWTTATLSTAVLVVWFVIGVVAVRLFGFTPGQFALGLTVISVDDRLHVGLGRAAVRGLLIALVVPPLFVDSDGRGLQDRLTSTAVVRR